MSPYAMNFRASVLNTFWRDHISDKYGIGGDTALHVRRPFAAVPKATFSRAMAVMDKVEGWKEEECVLSYLAASMWIYTKAALCDGRKRDPLLDLQPVLATITESVSWVTEDSQWDHEWITETEVTMKGNLILEAFTSLRHRGVMPSSEGFAMFFSTEKLQAQVREQRDTSGQIQGHS